MGTTPGRVGRVVILEGTRVAGGNGGVLGGESKFENETDAELWKGELLHNRES